jgi:hypothetical protein
MKPAEPPPTKEELIRALDDLFYAAHQSALYAYWKLVERPITDSLHVCGLPDARTYFDNGIIESSLLLIRKTTEFFKPKGDRDSPDTLYAYRYLEPWSGTWLVTKDDLYTELHKRVGHITIREARYGKQRWPVVQLTVRAVDQWISFFSELANSYVFDGNPPREKLDEFVTSLKEVSRGCRVLLQAEV